MRRRTFLMGAGASLIQKHAKAVDQFEINIDEVQRRPFWGFGFSITRTQAGRATFGSLREGLQRDLITSAFAELPVSWLRLWVPLYDGFSVTSMVDDFDRSYIGNGLLNSIFTTYEPRLLLAPAYGNYDRERSVDMLVGKLSEFIEILSAKFGIRFAATGLMNEPNDFANWELVEGVRRLRIALDTQRMGFMGIIAPETANADNKALRAIQDLRTSEAAWGSLRGVATHSYAMAATSDFREASEGKEYWITEVGSSIFGKQLNSNWEQEDAIACACRFLNDLNNGATHWIWYIGIGTWFSPVPDEVKHALSYVSKGAVVRSEKHIALRELLEVFPAGTEIYRCSTTHNGMGAWTYGQNSPIFALVGRRPDGKWGVAAANCSGLTSTPLQIFPERKEIEISLNFESDVRIANFSAGSSGILTGRKLQISLQPLQLSSAVVE